MDIIKLLPDSVANQIAAGEVIQRPASVVKELVENAIDAHATEITIIIKDAGRTLIQIIDNGTGMTPTDARLAFERHATSKITTATDLYTLTTMGFRGEALPSIAAVAQIDLRTLPNPSLNPQPSTLNPQPSTLNQDSLGTLLTIEASQITSQTPHPCTPGTNISVKNLFYNLPARRKFLKKDSVEMSNIIHEFERLALVNPTVEMTLIHNDITLHSLPKANLKQRIVSLFGKTLDAQLLPIETDTALCRINGFIVRPEHCRKRGTHQYLFTNGRNMRHPYFHKAILQCYEGLIPADEQPTYFINFTVDPATIDVNIHPTKNEIKFEQETLIRQILQATIKETLGRFNTAPTINFDDTDPFLNLQPTTTDQPSTLNPQPSTLNPTGNYNPFRPDTDTHTDWETLYRNFTTEATTAIAQAQGTLLPPDPENPQPSTLNQDSSLLTPNSYPQEDSSLLSPNSYLNENSYLNVGPRYVAIADPRGMRIIDLRRAHIAILHHHYTTAPATAHTSQQLLFPQPIDIPPHLLPHLHEHLPTLTTLGYQITRHQATTWHITAAPATTPTDRNPAQLLTEILQNLHDDDDTDTPTPTADRLATALATAAAFRADRTLTTAEIHHLLAQLMSLPLPGYTPTGQPTFTIITPADLTRHF